MIAITLMTIGALGECASVILEMRHHEPIYKHLMKIFPWVFCAGCVILFLGGEL